MSADKKTAMQNLNYRRWTSHEEHIIRCNIEHSVWHIKRRLEAAGYLRTENAINLKINRMRARTDRRSFSARELSLLMGVDHHTVMRWIRSGWLTASRRFDNRTHRQGGHMFIIKPESLRRFIQQHPLAFSLKKVDQLWFLDLIFEGELISSRKLIGTTGETCLRADTHRQAPVSHCVTLQG